MMPVLDAVALSGAPCWSAEGAEKTGSSTPTYSTAAPLTGTPGREGRVGKARDALARGVSHGAGPAKGAAVPSSAAAAPCGTGHPARPALLTRRLKLVWKVSVV